MTKTFGENMRIWRKRRGMTQTDLAEKLGITIQSVCRYENSSAEEVRPARRESIARALDVSVQALTGDSPEEDASVLMLTRGLQRMDAEKRECLIEMIMPYVRENGRADGDD